MADRGRWQCFQQVYLSVNEEFYAKNAGQVLDRDHGQWYRELFAPSVNAGLLKASDLAGYRNGPVLIRGSMHVPIRSDVVPEVMGSFFELLESKPVQPLRVVLGHFFFASIHPYFDGNERIGRFHMNVMLVSGSYPWTVIPVSKQKAYMDALEAACVSQDIIPLSRFIGGGLVRETC